MGTAKRSYRLTSHCNMRMSIELFLSLVGAVANRFDCTIVHLYLNSLTVLALINVRLFKLICSIDRMATQHQRAKLLVSSVKIIHRNGETTKLDFCYRATVL